MADISLEAESLFAGYLARRGTDEALDFESWVRRYPDCEADLRALHARDREVADGLVGARAPRSEERITFFRPARNPDSAEASARPRGERLRSGEKLGGFRLIQVIGSGGMGEVWEAEELALGRRVALKLVLPSRLDPRALDLFAREARAGGRLTHPCIVRVYGYGESSGVHWINQELIEGGWTLRDFIDEMREAESLPRDYYTRIAAFTVDLCEALQIAHDAEVIHRDIKPQNVLIGPDDRPKVSDFGLARIANETALTITGDFAGTYPYMSPEQIAAKRMGIDHRTDIFSVGVVLYELLSLRRPFEGDTTHQIAEKILTWDPPDLRKLRSRIPRELAVITGKALEKRPMDRFQTMAQFADDIRRFRANEPILARPPGSLRRAQKWVLRNPTNSTAAGLGVASLLVISGLVVGYVTSTVKNSELETANVELTAQRELVEAERLNVLRQHSRLTRVVSFLEGTLSNLDPESFGVSLRDRIYAELLAAAGEPVATAREASTPRQAMDEALSRVNFTDLGVQAIREEILDPARELALGGFEEDPLTRATLQASIAGTYESLGVLEPALELREQSLATRRELLGSVHPETLEAISSLGRLLEFMGRYDRAQPYLEEVLAVRRQLLGDDHLDTLRSAGHLGGLLLHMGKLNESLPYMLEALEGKRRTLGYEDPETLRSAGDMGNLLRAMGRFDEALPFAREALEGSRRVLGEAHPDTLTSMNSFGSLLSSMGRLEEAGPLLEEALVGSRQVFGSSHPATLESLSNMGTMIFAGGRPAEALPYFTEALQTSRETLGPEHPATIVGMINVGTAQWSAGNLAEAEPMLAEAHELNVRILGSDHPNSLTSMLSMGQLLLSRSNAEAALRQFERALWRSRLSLGDRHPQTLECLDAMGTALESLERFNEALPYFEESLESQRLILGPDNPDTLHSARDLGRRLIRQGDYAGASALFEETLERSRRVLPRSHSLRRSLIEELLTCYRALHQEDPDGGFAAQASALRVELEE